MSVLDIEPKAELKFHGPFNEIVSSEIVAKNFSKKTVGFKVKTTAPKQYCVRPNCGYVEPGKTVVITIMLQPIDPLANEKLKHKFLIQYMELNSPLPENPELVWKTVNKEDISEQKLRCIFVTDQKFDDRIDKHVNETVLNKDDHRGLTANKLEEKPANKSYMIFAVGVVVLSIIVAVFLGKFALA